MNLDSSHMALFRAFDQNTLIKEQSLQQDTNWSNCV